MGDGSPAAHEPRVDELFREHYGFVWQNVRRLGVPAALADDAVQDVFVTAHRRAGRFEGRSSPRTWLFGITRRIAYRYRRSSHRMDRKLTVLAREPAPTSVPDPARQLEATELLEHFLRGLARRQREAFILSELEGMTGPEVAEALGISRRAAYSRIRSARKRLHVAVARARRRDERTVVVPAIWMLAHQPPPAPAFALCEPMRPAAGILARFWSVLAPSKLATGLVGAATVVAATHVLPEEPVLHEAPVVSTVASHHEEEAPSTTLAPAESKEAGDVRAMPQAIALAPPAPVAAEKRERASAVRYVREPAKVKTRTGLSKRARHARKQAKEASEAPVDMMTAEDFARERKTAEELSARMAIIDAQIELLKRLIRTHEHAPKDI